MGVPPSPFCVALRSVQTDPTVRLTLPQRNHVLPRIPGCSGNIPMRPTATPGQQAGLPRATAAIWPGWEWAPGRRGRLSAYPPSGVWGRGVQCRVDLRREDPGLVAKPIPHNRAVALAVGCRRMLVWSGCGPDDRSGTLGLLSDARTLSGEDRVGEVDLRLHAVGARVELPRGRVPLSDRGPALVFADGRA